jgi:hypothetical protein
LCGVYYPNYLITCSAKSKVRRNLAYAQLLAMPMTLGPVAFGKIADHYGLRFSIEIAALVLVGTIFLVQLALPRRPSVAVANGDASVTS